MRRVVTIPKDEVIPCTGPVLKGQGVPERKHADERMTRLAQQAVSIYRDLAEPRGVVMEISNSEFETVYNGEAENEDAAPLSTIYPRATNLALFAVTIGEKLCGEITRLFDADDFALGVMLDAAASEGAELAAAAIESHYRVYLSEAGRPATSAGILRFSPGYCGWHVTSQKKLFELLRPGDIGIELSESYLMRPLKSVSGVIVDGPKEIFEFDDIFPFCKQCGSHSCRDRMKAVLEQ